MPEKKLSKAVTQVFDAYPQQHRKAMLTLRKLILDVAESIEGVGQLEETLKWGEPAYLTSASKTGTTIRIDWKPKTCGSYAIYFNCQTDLVQRCREQFPNDFDFEGDRAILFSTDRPMPVDSLSRCISMALTYHRDKTS